MTKAYSFAGSAIDIIIAIVFMTITVWILVEQIKKMKQK
jgi:hypothetical protein